MRYRMPTSKHVTDQCFASVVAEFMGPTNPKWNLPPPQGYAKGTKESWGRELRLAMRPTTLGALSVFALRSALTQAYLDELAAWPAKQVAALSALRQVEKWALRHDRIPYPFTLGCEAEGSDGGHIPWDEDCVSLAERFARRDLARAVTLAAGTGQRGSDLVKMAWTDIEVVEGRPGINVIQKKTKRKLWVPFTGSLTSAIAGWERSPGPILRKLTGNRWSRRALSWEWSQERENNPALESLRLIGAEQRPAVMHGLRGTAVQRLSRAGATTRQICDMVGMSEQMVTRYLRFSQQKQSALAAVIMLDRTARERGQGVK